MKSFAQEIASQKFQIGLIRLEREYGFARLDRPRMNEMTVKTQAEPNATKKLLLRWLALSWEEVSN